jgi:hypothetical protein
VRSQIWDVLEKLKAMDKPSLWSTSFSPSNWPIATMHREGNDRLERQIVLHSRLHEAPLGI